MLNQRRKLVCFFLAFLCLAGVLASCKTNSVGNDDQSQSAETIVTGTDEDGMKYTTVSLTDSGLAITPSYDVNGNIASFAHTRETFAEVAQTHA